MGGTVHASILKDDIVRAFREEQRGQALQALKGYEEICTRAEVMVNQELLLLDCMLWSLVDDRIVTAYSSSRFQQRY